MAYELGNNPYARGYREVRSWPAVILWLRIKWLCETYNREWITRTRDEWCADLAMTLKVYKEAVALLKRMKLIDTKKSLKVKGSVTMLRVTERGTKLLDPKIPMDLIGAIMTVPIGAINKKEGTLTSSNLKKEVDVPESGHVLAPNPHKFEDSGEGKMPTVKGNRAQVRNRI